jgi:hypothetical protein
LKRNQLRELAALNGTLRDDENQACQNCGQIGHRKYDCTEQRNFTANIICRVCGNAGHMARDCPDRYAYFAFLRARRMLTYSRQRGANWRNDGPGGPPGPAAGRIGAGDAVDREYEVYLDFPLHNQRILIPSSNLCKNSLAVLQPMEMPPDALNLVLVVDLIKVLQKMLNLGNVAQQVLLLLGKSVEMIVDLSLEIQLQPVVLHLGPEIVVEVTIMLLSHIMVARMDTAHHLDHPATLLHGNNLLPILLLLPLVILATLLRDILVATPLSKPWVHLLVLHHHLD